MMALQNAYLKQVDNLAKRSNWNFKFINRCSEVQNFSGNKKVSLVRHRHSQSMMRCPAQRIVSFSGDAEQKWITARAFAACIFV